jgi:hypothetical protein
MLRRLVHAVAALVTLTGIVLLPQLPAAASTGYTTIVGLQSQKCINIPNDQSANGILPIIYPCGTKANMSFIFDDDIRLPNTPGYYNIQNSQTAKCLVVKGASKEQNQPIIQYDCNRGTNEQWSTQLIGQNYYYIINQNSGLCLTVKGAVTTTGQTLLQYKCNGGDNQKWTW